MWMLVLDHAAGAGLQQAQRSVDWLLSLIFASLSQVSYEPPTGQVLGWGVATRFARCKSHAQHVRKKPHSPSNIGFSFVLQTFIGSLKGPSLKNELNLASEMQAAGDVLQLVENVSEEEGNKSGSRDGDGARGGGCSGTSKLHRGGPKKCLDALVQKKGSLRVRQRV
jgi:hypothetical protein